MRVNEVKVEIAAIGQIINYRYHEFSYGASIHRSALDWTLVRMHVVLDVCTWLQAISTDISLFLFKKF